MSRRPWHSWLIRLTLGLGLLPLPLILAANASVPKNRAIILMGTGLFLFWCLAINLTLWHCRDTFRAWFLRWKAPLFLRFFGFSLALLLIEEAITTTMTNLAPVFGSKVGEAYITGSSNYVDVVLWHSVVALFPSILAWSWLIAKRAVHPNTAYLAWGFQGYLAELSYGGPGQLPAIAFWISVYGPMLYLPAYCAFGLGGTQRPRFRDFLAMAALAIILTIPSAAFVHTYRPASAAFPTVKK